jgi:Ca2+/Na+ antiporter
MASIMIYALLNKKDIHKPTLFILFGIYAVYTAVETWLLSRQAREVK